VNVLKYKSFLKAYFRKMSAVHFGKQMIESRRKADNAYREMDMVIASDKRIKQLAQFENVTTNKIERNMKKVESILFCT